MLRARRSQSSSARKDRVHDPRRLARSQIAEGDGGALKGQRAPHWNQRMPMPAKTTE
jgi:hypothetical protein